jgi:hypothetical protein
LRDNVNNTFWWIFEVNVSSQIVLESAFCRFNGDFISRASLIFMGFACSLSSLTGDVYIDISINGHPFIHAGNISVLPLFSSSEQFGVPVVVGPLSNVKLKKN